ncbi:hypothetical protein T4A_6327 [Trichinella pseudospiralis]|uniref:Uncharacterized protein n=1 Tax=Trichinella pseudospiralis TaxID=6337 RepID=A0A0V1DQ72_TRIPS|nr:hypothetical protein T4A_6327 [Trichinella pseudospiralis]
MQAMYNNVHIILGKTERKCSLNFCNAVTPFRKSQFYAL